MNENTEDGMQLADGHGGRRHRVATAVIAAIGACGLAFAVPSAAFALDAAPDLADSADTTDISSTSIDVDIDLSGTSGLTGTTRGLGDAIGHIHDTNEQIRQDIATHHQHMEQIHSQIHQDANDLRQHREQAWQDAQQAHDDIKNAIDGAYDRAHDRHETIHQDMVDTQTHLNQLHANLKTEHDLLKQQHLQWVSARDQWHRNLQAALSGSGLNGGAGSTVTNASGTVTNAAQTTTGSTTPVSSGSSAASAGSGATSASNGSSSDTVAGSLQNGELAVTGVGAPAVLSAVTLGLLLNAVLLKVVAQYKRETSGR